MSSSNQLIKRHNHRVHPCENEKKLEMLKHLLDQNLGETILIVTEDDLEELKNIETNENVTILSDISLSEREELTCDILISYNLPSIAGVYLKRLSHVKTRALILLDIKEQKRLYPIETLLGRTVMQESVKGFETNLDKEIKLKKENALKAKNEKRDDKPRYDKPYKEDKRSSKKPYSKDRDTKDNKSDKWAKKDKGTSKYIGKDENGKSIFSGKTGDRNHSYDGTPKARTPKTTGKRINIKSLKERNDKEDK